MSLWPWCTPPPRPRKLAPGSDLQQTILTGNSTTTAAPPSALPFSWSSARRLSVPFRPQVGAVLDAIESQPPFDRAAQAPNCVALAADGLHDRGAVDLAREVAPFLHDQPLPCATCVAACDSWHRSAAPPFVVPRMLRACPAWTLSAAAIARSAAPGTGRQPAPLIFSSPIHECCCQGRPQPGSGGAETVAARPTGSAPTHLSGIMQQHSAPGACELFHIWTIFFVRKPDLVSSSGVRVRVLHKAGICLGHALARFRPNPPPSRLYRGVAVGLSTPVVCASNRGANQVGYITEHNCCS